MGRSTGTRVRWLIVFMAFLGTTINYIDRANLGVALPLLSKELGLGPEASGLVLGAFFWTYAVFQLPSGLVRRPSRSARGVYGRRGVVVGVHGGHGDRARIRIPFRVPASPRRRRGARLPHQRQGRLRVVPQERTRPCDEHLRQRRACRHRARAADLHVRSSRCSAGGHRSSLPAAWGWSGQSRGSRCTGTRANTPGCPTRNAYIIAGQPVPSVTLRRWSRDSMDRPVQVPEPSGA